MIYFVAFHPKQPFLYHTIGFSCNHHLSKWCTYSAGMTRYPQRSHQNDVLDKLCAMLAPHLGHFIHNPRTMIDAFIYCTIDTNSEPYPSWRNDCFIREFFHAYRAVRDIFEHALPHKVAHAYVPLFAFQLDAIKFAE